MATKDEGTGARRRPATAQADPVETKARRSPRKRSSEPQPVEVEQAGSAAPALADPGERLPTRAVPHEETITPEVIEATAPLADPVEIADEEGGAVADDELSAAPVVRRRDRQRGGQANALGMLIEARFSDPTSPCRSYSDLERHSSISREALSRYVTARPDRRRSPTIDTLVAVADALHLSLEGIARAAAASVKGVQLPPQAEQQVREEVLGTLVSALSDEQFSAVVELLRQLRPIQARG